MYMYLQELSQERERKIPDHKNGARSIANSVGCRKGIMAPLNIPCSEEYWNFG